MLSGGAGMGLHHFGLMKALYEQNLIPKIITGSSVGSLIAATFATKTLEEIPNVIYLNYKY